LSVVQKAGKIGVQKWRENERNNEHDKIVQHFPQMAFFSKANVMIQFLHNLALF
jgi:hypothetical protein